VIATLKRLLNRSIRRGASGRRQPSLQELQTIRAALLYCIEDCHNVSAQRVRHKIEHARTGQELWLLRNDAYQLISQRHSQTLAAERINGLMHCFEGFMEARQLVRIK
jgi:hypothetical protein